MENALLSVYHVPDIHLTWRGDNSLGSSSYRVYRSPGDTTHIESAPSATISVSASGPGGGGDGGGNRHNSGTIAGRAVDSLTGKAIPAVQISFFRVSSPGLPVQKILTDGSGRYRAHWTRDCIS